MKIKDIIKYSLPVFASVLSVAACDDQQLDKDEISPRICVSAEIEVPTKAALEQLGGSAQVKLYDILPGVDYEKRINGATASFGTDTWTISNEPADGYSWLKGGSGADKTSKVDHHFFAFLSKDNEGITDASLFGTSLSLTDSTTPGVYTITVPETQMLLTSSQFDLAYSEMVNRMARDADYSKVNIPLKHFFSCFNLKVHNYTDSPITVTSITLYGLTNKKSGLVTYNTNDGTVATSYSAASSGSVSWTEASPATLFSGSQEIVSEAEKQLFDTHLMWPQTAEELDDAYIVVKYKIGSSATQTSAPICIKPSGSAIGWDAGSRHEIELAFRDKEFTLTVKALPWDLYHPEIDYSGGVSVKETGMLSFNDAFCTVDEANKRVYSKGGNPITIYFTIDAPLNATWQITKKGDWDYFEIDNPVYTEYGDPLNDSNYGTIDGKRAMVTLYPTDSKSGTHKIQLSFSVRTNSGREINADELIQGPKQYFTVDGDGNPTDELTTTVTPYPAPTSLYYYTFVSE